MLYRIGPWPLMRTRDRSRRRRRCLQSLSLHLLRLYITEWGREVVPAKTRLPLTLDTSPYAADYSVNIKLVFLWFFLKSNTCSLNSVIFVMAVYTCICIIFLRCIFVPKFLHVSPYLGICIFVNILCWINF